MSKMAFSGHHYILPLWQEAAVQCKNCLCFWRAMECAAAWSVHSPTLFLSSVMKSSFSWSVIPTVEQSPTPHSAPRRQYLSWISLSFLETMTNFRPREAHHKNVAPKLSHKYTRKRTAAKASKSAHGITYFSLFCLDFSSSSLSTLEDLNLESFSAYFLWFSASEFIQCKSRRNK